MNDEIVRLINKTEDYIDAHIDEKITLDDLATYIGMSKFHYHRLFRQGREETLHQFIMRHKLERSAIFLKVRSDLSITDIALRYGYSESSAYTRAFKNHFGVSPQTYRTAR